MAEMPMEQQGASSGGGELEKLVGNIMKGLSLLAEGLSQQRPEAGEAIMGVAQQLDGVLSEILGGGGGGEKAPQPQGPKAVPVQESQGKPVGPAGV